MGTTYQNVRVFVALSFCFGTLVSGCTGAQMEARRMQTVGNETITSGQACIQQIADNPEYSHLKTKLYIGTDNQYPLEMLTDGSHPTKAEITQVYRVYGDIQQCRKIILDGAAKMHPLVLLTFVEAFSDGDKIWAEAVTGRLTWGQFNERRKDINAQIQFKMTQANAQIASQLQNQHQFEVEQRQRAAAAMQQWAYQQQLLSQQQQLIYSINQPRMTTINCNYYGNTASCSSF